MLKKNIYHEYNSCNLCPRHCGVNRNIKKGFCGEISKLSIDKALIHFGEEPPISHRNGSGTIFFTGCSLRCPFCQNMQISQSPQKKNYFSTEEFVELMESLLDRGAENINFVTPDQFMPHIIDGVKRLKTKRENAVLVYNCSGYQSIEHLKQVIDYIDIFLFDYKFADRESAVYCINNPDYSDICQKGLDFLYHKKGNLALNDEGKGISGVLVRHLIIPDFVENSLKVLNNLFLDYGKDIYFSLMSQYSPRFLKRGLDKINRCLTRAEYDEVVGLAFELGFTNGFIQDFIEGEDAYIPDFERKKMFDRW